MTTFITYGVDKATKISTAEYSTLLSFTEKYSNGQRDAYFPLKAKISEWLKIDIKDAELFEILNEDNNRLAFGRFLHDNAIMVIGEGGIKYAVMTTEDTVYLDDWDSYLDYQHTLSADFWANIDLSLVADEIAHADALDASVIAMEKLKPADENQTSKIAKKFKMDACYKAYSNAEEISRCTYNVQITNRTAQYVTAQTYKGIERYRVKTDADGVEYINISRQDGRRALICRADSKVETTPISAEIGNAIIAVFDLKNEEVTADTAEYIAEDDGSNDDDYDEDEISVTYNVDNDEDDDDDVDPPIETAESKEEEEMKEVKVPASTTTEIKKFEVGKIYFPCDLSGKPRIKITKRTAKTVHYKIERFNGEFDCETRANIQIWGGSEHFYSSYLYRSYYALDEEETAVETKNTEITAETENVTAENNVEIEKLEKKLASLKLFSLNTDEYMQACVYSIKKYYACIAKAEEDMWKFQLEKEQYEREVAELENEIANQRIIDATDEIVTADALDASVAAMVELNAANFTAIFNDVENNFTTANLLNSANDFTTANLLDAVNAADKAVENIPIVFELQNFTAKTVTTDNYATIDTAVTLASTPPLSTATETALETAMHNKNVFKKTIKVQQRRIEHFENEIFKAEQTILQSKREIERLKKQQRELQEAIIDCENFIRQSSPIEILTETADKIAAEFNKIPYKDSDEELMKIVATDGTIHSLPRNFGDLSLHTLHGKILIMLQDKVLASYFTRGELETAMNGLMKAIQNHADTYEFQS